MSRSSRPVVLIPGIGGSILVQKGNELRRLFHKSVPNNRWVNIYVATKEGLQTWKKDMRCKITYDHDGTIVRASPENTLIYPYDFGGTRGIKDILPEFLLFPPQYQHALEDMFHHRYFHSLVSNLHKAGYKDHQNLLGAPFDFRFVLDPDVRRQFFADLRALIETSCRRDGERAVIVTHSLGGLVFKWFANGMDQSWIDKHIEHWVCISAPFGGAFNALYAATSGDHYLSSMRAQVKPELQSNQGIVMCFPNTLAFDKDEPLIHINNRASPITIGEYPRLHGIPFKIWTDLYKAAFEQDISTVAKIPTHVICGSINGSTDGAGRAESWDDTPYRKGSLTGDRVVPLQSLLAIERVIDPKYLTETIMYGEDHTSVLNHPDVIRVVQRYAFKAHKCI